MCLILSRELWERNTWRRVQHLNCITVNVCKPVGVWQKLRENHINRVTSILWLQQATHTHTHTHTHHSDQANVTLLLLLCGLSYCRSCAPCSTWTCRVASSRLSSASSAINRATPAPSSRRSPAPAPTSASTASSTSETSVSKNWQTSRPQMACTPTF